MKLYWKACILLFLSIAEMWVLHVGLLWIGSQSDIMPLLGVAMIVVAIGLGIIVVRWVFKKEITYVKGKVEDEIRNEKGFQFGGHNDYPHGGRGGDGVRRDDNPSR